MSAIETNCFSISKLDELKTYCNQNLNQNYQGYIQWSGKRIDMSENFSDWKKEGFIFEAAFYDGETSIFIREINDKLVVTKFNMNAILNDKKYSITKQTYFNTIKGKPNKKNESKVIMAQIWEAKENEQCNGFEVFEPICQVFIGFEGEKR